MAKQKKHVDQYNRLLTQMDKEKISQRDRKEIYLGLIAGYLAVIADALEERKVGDTDGNS